MREFVLYRIDIAVNFQVGKSVQDFLRVLSLRHYPHRDTDAKLGKQVQFSTEYLVLIFYDKQKQCGNMDAFGILRMEARFCSKRVIQNWLGANKPTLEMVTEAIALSRLVHELHLLKLDPPISGGLVQRITRVPGRSPAMKRHLVAYVTLREEVPWDRLREFYTKRQRTYYENQLLEIGLQGQTTSNVGTPPSLLSVLEAESSFRNHVPSETGRVAEMGGETRVELDAPSQPIGALLAPAHNAMPNIQPALRLDTCTPSLEYQGLPAGRQEDWRAK